MLISRSLLRGFGRGLAAPGLLVNPYRVQRDPRFDASVENAWKEVGRYLDGAIAIEGERIGKKTSSAAGHNRRHKHAAE